MQPPAKKHKSDVTMAPPPHVESAAPKLPSLVPIQPEQSIPMGSSPDLTEVHAGKRIGKYQIGKLIGRGGMGAVYEALDVPLQRKVALKILPHEFSSNEEALQRFIREARLAARLNHPNTVAVYEIAKKGTVYFIAMELVNGASGQELLERGTTLDWRAVTRAITDACRGLSAAHEQGMIHRDIKPGNLLWTETGSVKVSDFGLAKPPKTEDLSLTRRDQFVGTPLYMSPEQCRNDNVDHRSDIYSLGATYFTMLSGKAPFNQGSALQILFAHCSAPIPDVSESNPDVPPMCTHVIQKAMAKRPEDRYQSADEMLADLETVAGTSPEDQAQMLEALNAAAKVESSIITAESLVAGNRKSHVPLIIGSAVALVLIAVLLLAVFMSGTTANDVVVERPVAAPRKVTIVSDPPKSAPVQPIITPTPVAVAAVNPLVAASPEAEPARVEPKSAPPTPAPPAAAAVIENRPSQPASNPLGQLATATLIDESTQKAQTPAPPVTEEPPVQSPPEPAPAATEPEPTQAPKATPPVRRTPPPDEKDFDPLMNRLSQAKQFAEEAAKTKDPKKREVAAQIMIAWYDFLRKAPREDHKKYAPAAQKMAEALKPGITNKPRVLPPPEEDAPLPPQNPRFHPDGPPEDRERPERPRRQPPQKQPSR